MSGTLFFFFFFLLLNAQFPIDERVQEVLKIMRVKRVGNFLRYDVRIKVPKLRDVKQTVTVFEAIETRRNF